MTSCPPFGIASRALIARLRSAFSIWPGIGHDHGQPSGEPSLDLDRLAKAAPQQFGHACGKRIKVRRFWIERLASAEGEQPFSQLGAELGCLLSLLQKIAMIGNREPPLQHLEIAGDHRQKVVEVVRKAASELADRLHLLRLP